ncbi:MAG TPA: dihydroorotate dehydrogenase [Acidobacteriota bacterium]|nr:dihydroorotate dehydrogenase [Acidobacteriota bacterium]
MNENVNLEVEIAGVRFKNPVLTASGTFGYGLEFAEFFDISRLGGFCTKGLSLYPMEGNPPGRISETPSGMLNAIGLENIGVDRFIAERLPQLRQYDCVIVANIFGKTIDEFVSIAEKLNGQEQVASLELNISCPNIKEGGVQFGHDPKMAFRVTQAVVEVSRKPVWVKLSPNVTDIRIFARACERAGADALSLVNTFVGMAVDVDRRRPMLSHTTGGLSGPAIRPLAVRLVRQVVETVEIPVVGIGGIASARDALEFLIAGARAIQVGTANFVDPTCAIRVIDGLQAFCTKNKISDINELVGTLEPVKEGALHYY